jgi:hypothetical protein
MTGSNFGQPLPEDEEPTRPVIPGADTLPVIPGADTLRVIPGAGTLPVIPGADTLPVILSLSKDVAFR